MFSLGIKEKSIIKKVAKKYSLKLLLLFGSRVFGKTHRESDFDVAYLSKKNLGLEKEAKLICDLMPVFGSEAVDLTNISRAAPLLLKEIFDKHDTLFSKDPKIYFQYKVYASKKYLEAKPLFGLREKYIKNFIKTHA